MLRSIQYQLTSSWSSLATSCVTARMKHLWTWRPSIASSTTYSMSPPAPLGAWETSEALTLSAQYNEALMRSWAPASKLRRHRGVHRLASGQQHEIDAIGEREGCLLLVEAKSFPRTADYDMASRRAVRNVSEKVDLAVRAQALRRESLSSGKTNRGLDISKWARVEALVCTPGPLFVAIRDSTERTSIGVLRCCSLDELDAALNDKSS